MGQFVRNGYNLTNSLQEDLRELNEIYEWNPLANISQEQNGLTCVNDDSPYRRWIQTLGFKQWSKNNCEYAFTTAYLTNCSVIRTNGVEERLAHDDETRQLHNDCKYVFKK